ncbi:MAG: hypothetical protein ABIP49_01195 [Lysobacterales bacterium]
MKCLLSMLALGLLAGCATYPDYGYYDHGRSYDRYDSRGYDDGRYGGDRGGDYYYSTRPDRSYYYDDGYYGYGPYSSGYGYGGYGSYGGYGYGGFGGYGGYGGSLGYSFGSRPRISLGYSSGGYGGYYPYGGYYGGYGSYGSYYPYGSYYGYYGHRSNNYRYNSYDNRSSRNDPWLDARERAGSRGDGVIDDDASNLADQIARERGVRDATPRSFSPGADSRGSYRDEPTRGEYSRERDTAPSQERGGWRSDYRDAQLASPRAAAVGGLSSAAAGAPQLRIEPAQTQRNWRQPEFREQAMPQTQPVQTWRSQDARAAQNNETAGWGRSRDAQPRGDSRQSNVSPRFESAPQRVSQSRPEPREHSRSDVGGSNGNYSRDRDVNDPQ